MEEDIFSYMEGCAPREGCGVVVIANGEKTWIPCGNDSVEADEFIINKKDFIVASMYYELVAIVHSHINQEDLKLSDHDIMASKYLNVPYWVVGIPQREIIKYNG